ncbi:5-oxoprolinase subunit PxpB [Halobacillus yeomjeoni]|uniref:5-oxoprolinase subunit PxpB n=1 Tax=Halobacillus yeomjeoni TaxID=311194 RepID=A0A931MWB5_9BACI|nr:5-oxoprolinase subunit PxpB [Halobacillus yeomjeoni]MBH0231239.1 5-oxoprolinase subunit PxpB [Halobacillus yeomjeoni]
MDAEYYSLGDQAIVIELGDKIERTTHQRVKEVSEYLKNHPPYWMIEYIPAFTTVTVFYDPIKVMQDSTSSKLPYSLVCEKLDQQITNLEITTDSKPRLIEIPVCYGGEFGPDLSYVAEKNEMSEDDVIEIHKNGDYLVYMIGFAPGFPYIGGMDERIATSRRDDPRLKIPAGSVGIAGGQTGVYPIETPGGWQLIGRTPTKLFDAGEEVPSLLQAGDQIKFTSITEEEYHNWEGTNS